MTYQRFSQWIDGARVSLSAVAQSQRVTTEQLRDFLQKIKINLFTFNIPKILATSDNVGEVDDDGNRSDSAHDYSSDCTVVYDRSSMPPTLIVAQRAGEEHEMTGGTTLTSPIAIYKVDVTSGGVSANTYPSLYESPHSPLLVEMVRHNVTDRSLIIHRPFDLPNDDEHWVLLSKVDELLADWWQQGMMIEVWSATIILRFHFSNEDRQMAKTLNDSFLNHKIQLSLSHNLLYDDNI